MISPAIRGFETFSGRHGYCRCSDAWVKGNWHIVAAGVCPVILRQLNSSGKPPLGRKDILGTNSTGLWPGGSLTRSRCSMVATTNVISAMANVWPMHILGPPPKGK